MRAILDTISQGVKSFFSSRQKRDSPRDLLLMLVELPCYTSTEYLPQVVKDRVLLHRYLGYRVQIKPAQAEIPDGYICRVSCWNAGQLEYQEYLKTQVECVEKTRIVVERISPPIPTLLSIDPDNTLSLEPFPAGSIVIDPYSFPYILMR